MSFIRKTESAFKFLSESETMKNFVMTVLLSLVMLVSISGCVEDSAPAATGGINGVVSDATTGEPIAGVNLTLSPSGLSKISGNDGRYEFQNVEPQQYDVQAQKVGYKYNVKSATVSAGQFAKCDIAIEAK